MGYVQSIVGLVLILQVSRRSGCDARLVNINTNEPTYAPGKQRM
jgi:hypothetical protein